MIRDAFEPALGQFASENDGMQWHTWVHREAGKRVVQVFGRVAERNGDDGTAAHTRWCLRSAEVKIASSPLSASEGERVGMRGHSVIVEITIVPLPWALETPSSRRA